jgi:hypothetical protein
MKTLKKLFLYIAFIGLLFSCSNSDQTGLDLSGLSDTNPNGKAIMQDGIFLVEPNGTDDTEALKDAFNDATIYGKGAIVQLVEGEYYLNFIEVREFSGKFKGAGKGKTVITTASNIDDDPLISQNLNTILIRFVGGDVYLSDMTLKTPPGVFNPDPFCNWLDGLVGFFSLTAQYTSINKYINAVIDNVEFKGHWENTNAGLKAQSGFRNTIPGGIPLSDIDISVTNCSFDGFASYGALIMEIREGKIIAGTKNNGNIFDNNCWASLGIWHNTSVKVLIEGNTFFNPTGTRCGIELNSSPYPGYLEQVPQIFASVCNIEQNMFNITGGLVSIASTDNRRKYFPEELPMLVQVKNNHFNMSNNSRSIGCSGMYGMVIRNNRFSGNGSYGVRILTFAPVYNENGLMLGNNFSNATYSVTTVLLDAGSRNWTIVGGDLGERIINLGENNIINGFNNNTSEVPPGQTIVDNLEEMREAVHDLKNP